MHESGRNFSGNKTYTERDIQLLKVSQIYVDKEYEVIPIETISEHFSVSFKTRQVQSSKQDYSYIMAKPKKNVFAL